MRGIRVWSAAARAANDGSGGRCPAGHRGEVIVSVRRSGIGMGCVGADCLAMTSARAAGAGGRWTSGRRSRSSSPTCRGSPVVVTGVVVCAVR